MTVIKFNGVVTAVSQGAPYTATVDFPGPPPVTVIFDCTIEEWFEFDMAKQAGNVVDVTYDDTDNQPDNIYAHSL